jgi:hypothetical protein
MWRAGCLFLWRRRCRVSPVGLAAARLGGRAGCAAAFELRPLDGLATARCSQVLDYLRYCSAHRADARRTDPPVADPTRLRADRLDDDESADPTGQLGPRSARERSVLGIIVPVRDAGSRIGETAPSASYRVRRFALGLVALARGAVESAVQDRVIAVQPGVGREFIRKTGAGATLVRRVTSFTA